MSAFKNKATSGGGDNTYEVPPAGSHAGILVALVDLGTQEEDYQGQTKKTRKLFMAWELTGEQTTEGANFIVGRDYTNSLGEKANLRKIIESCRGKPFAEGEEFDFSKMLNKPYLLTLVHKTSQSGKKYAKIESVGPLPKGMQAAPATKTPFMWEVGDSATLPEWLPYVYGEPAAEVIARSQEAKGGITTAAPTEVNNDELAAMF